MDLAELGITVNTEGLVAGTTALRALRDAAAEAALSIDKLDSSTAKMIAAAAGSSQLQVQLKGQMEAANTTMMAQATQIDQLSMKLTAYESTIKRLSDTNALLGNQLSDVQQRLSGFSTGASKSMGDVEKAATSLTAKVEDTGGRISAAMYLALNSWSSQFKAAETTIAELTPILDAMAERFVAAGVDSSVGLAAIVAAMEKLKDSDVALEVANKFSDAFTEASVAADLLAGSAGHVDKTISSVAATSREAGLAFSNVGKNTQQAAIAFDGSNFQLQKYSQYLKESMAASNDSIQASVFLKQAIKDVGIESANASILIGQFANYFNLTSEAGQATIQTYLGNSAALRQYMRDQQAADALETKLMSNARAMREADLADYQAMIAKKSEDEAKLIIALSLGAQAEEQLALQEAAAQQKSSDAMLKAANPKAVKIQQLTDLQAVYNQRIADGVGNELENSVAVTGITAQLEKLTKVTDGHTASLNKNFIALEAGREIEDLLTGKMANAERTGLTLANAFGLMTYVFSGTGLAIAGVTAALVAAVVIGTEFQNSQLALTNALQVTGNTAGFSATQIGNLAAKTDESTSLSIGSAKSLMTQLVQTGSVGGAALEELALHGDDLSARFGGKDNDGLLKFAQSLQDPAKAADTAVKSLTGLSTSWANNVKEMAASGDTTGAQVKIIQAYSDGIKGLATQVNWFDTALHSAAKTWDDFIHGKFVQPGANPLQAIDPVTGTNTQVPVSDTEAAAAAQKQLAQQTLNQANAVRDLVQAQDPSIAQIKILTDQQTNLDNLFKQNAVDLETYTIRWNELQTAIDSVNLSGQATVQSLIRLDDATAGKIGGDLANAQLLLQLRARIPGNVPDALGILPKQLSPETSFAATDAATQARVTAQNQYNKAQADLLPLLAAVNAAQGQGADAVAAANRRYQEGQAILKIYTEDAAKLFVAGKDWTVGLIDNGKAVKDLGIGLNSVDVSKFTGAALAANKQLSDQATIMAHTASVLPQYQAGEQAYWTAYFQYRLQGQAADQASANASKARLNTEQQLIDSGAKNNQQALNNLNAQIAETAAIKDGKAALADVTTQRQTEADVLNGTLALKNQLLTIAVTEIQQSVDTTKGLADQAAQMLITNAGLQAEIDLHGRNRAAQQNAIETAKLDVQTTQALALATNALNAAKAAGNSGAIDTAQREYDLTVQTIANLKTENDEHSKLTVQLQDQNRELSAFSQEVKKAADQVDTQLTTALADAFDGQKVTDWAAVVRKALSDIAADLINIALIRPAIGSALTSLGLTQAASSFAGGSSGGGSSATGSSSSSSLSNLPLGSLFNGGGLGEAGTSISNFIFGTPTVTRAGTAGVGLGDGLLPGSTDSVLGSGASLSQIGTGLGGVAGVAGGIVGLMNSANQNAAGIAGDVAQLAGGATALLSTFGVIGVSGGPIGLAIAAVGAVVSSLFGNKHPEHPTGQATATLDSLGNQVGNFNDFTTDGGNASGAESVVSTGILPFVQSLQKQFGLDLQGVEVNFLNNAGQAAVGANKTTSGNPGSEFFYDPTDAQAQSDAFTKLTLSIIQNANSVDNADLAYARANISINDTAANIQKMIQFALDFQTTVGALNSGGGFDPSKSINATAQQTADQLQSQITQFTSTTGTLFAGGPQIQQANDAIKSYLQTLIGLKDPIDQSLTPMETAVKTVQANLTALTPLLNQFGITSSDVANALAIDMNTLKVNETASLTQQLNAADGKSYLNDLQTQITTFTQNQRDAVASGADTNLAYNIALAQATSTLQNLTIPQLQEVQRQFYFVANGAAVVSASTTLLAQANAAAASSNSDVIQNITAAAQQMADSMNQAASDIRAAIISLLGGTSSDLAPADKLQFLQSQFNATPSSDTANQLLQFGQTYYGQATQQYNDLFKSTLTGLATQGANDSASAVAAQLNAQSVAASIAGVAQPNIDITASSDAARQAYLATLPSFDIGGTVPGPIGHGRPIMAHGGEEVVSNNSNSPLMIAISDLNTTMGAVLRVVTAGVGIQEEHLPAVAAAVTKTQKALERATVR